MKEELFEALEVIVHTADLTAEKLKSMYPDCPESDAVNWAKVYALLDDQKAYVLRAPLHKGEFMFLGLQDTERSKEATYLMEQDSQTGQYINQRSDFNRDWENCEYSNDAMFYLEENQVEVVGNGKKK